MPRRLKGTEFRSVMADSNVLWRVTRSLGGGYFEAIAVNEPFEIGGRTFDSDFAGQTKAFSRKEIEQSLAIQEAFERNRAQHVDFWAAQPVGTVLHYCNGFEEYVRGEVVVLDATNCETAAWHGTKGLLPTALVGDWHQGHMRHHVEGISEGRAWPPNASCVWESPTCATQYKRVDPRGLDPIHVEA